MFYFDPANAGMFIPMILVLANAHPKARAALLYPGRRFATVCLDQALNIANALAFGNDPRLTENPGGQLRNGNRPLGKSGIYPSNISGAPGSPDRQIVDIQNNHQRALEISERRFALPASTTSSKSGSFLNRPASCSHHARRDAIRTLFNSALICRSCRSRTFTRRSNLLAEDFIAPSLRKREYTKCAWEETRPGEQCHRARRQRGVGDILIRASVEVICSRGVALEASVRLARRQAPRALRPARYRSRLLTHTSGRRSFWWGMGSERGTVDFMWQAVSDIVGLSLCQNVKRIRESLW